MNSILMRVNANKQALTVQKLCEPTLQLRHPTIDPCLQSKPDGGQWILSFNLLTWVMCTSVHGCDMA